MNLPIIVRKDYIGAIFIFMSENASTGVCTRHVDTRYHFLHIIRFIKTEFVQSTENDVDIFMENVNQELYKGTKTIFG